MFTYPFVACLVIGVFCLLFGAKRVLLAFKSHRWPTVYGNVTRSKLRVWYNGQLKTEHNIKSYSWDFLYTFKVEGKDYKSNNASYKPQRNNMNKAYMESLIEAFPKGANVVVYYHPRNPKLCVLKPGFHISVLIFPIVGVVFLVAAYLLYVQA